MDTEQRQRFLKMKKRTITVAVIVVLIASLIVTTLEWRGAGVTWDGIYKFFGFSDDDGSLASVYYISVGEGDATLLVSGGQTALVDCGPAPYASKLRYWLDLLQIDHIDYLVLTHPHVDHISGAPELFTNFSVSTLITQEFLPESDEDYDCFGQIISLAHTAGIPVLTPSDRDTVTVGNAVVSFFLPSQNASDENERSMVVSVCAGDRKTVIMADAGSETELALFKGKYDLSCNVLRVGHHGSKNGTGTILLESAAPRYAVISVGEYNSYGHPSEETVNRLVQHHVEVLRTDYLGTLAYKIFADHDGMYYFADRELKSVETVLH